MVYKIPHIARDVRIAIDENKTSEQLISLGDIETLSLDDIIHSKIVEAVRRVEINAPVYMLDSGNNFGDAVFWEANGSGWVLLPDDFMRLISFRMSDWERTVYEAISTDDVKYPVQASRYKGIRGNCQKPVCAMTMRPEGKALEFYSCKNRDAKVVQAVYLPYPRIENCQEEIGIDICIRCYTAVIYTTAALVCLTFGADDRTSVFMELAKSALI